MHQQQYGSDPEYEQKTHSMKAKHQANELTDVTIRLSL